MLRQDGFNQPVQGFAPVEIIEATSLDTTKVLAIRIPAAVGYQINNTGVTGTMPAGVTVIGTGVNSIDFTETITVEVMR